MRMELRRSVFGSNTESTLCRGGFDSSKCFGSNEEWFGNAGHLVPG